MIVLPVHTVYVGGDRGYNFVFRSCPSLSPQKKYKSTTEQWPARLLIIIGKVFIFALPPSSSIRVGREGEGEREREKSV